MALAPAIVEAGPRTAATVVLGLGNPILADDAAGLLVAARLRTRLAGEAIAVRELCWGGFSIVDELGGFDWALLIDAIETFGDPPGTVREWTVPERCPSKRLISYHDMGLFTALEFGRVVGLTMPRWVSVFTVEAEDVTTVTERLSPAVEAALPRLEAAVMRALRRGRPLEGRSADLMRRIKR